MRPQGSMSGILDERQDAAFWLLRRDAGLDLEHDPTFVSWRDATPENAAIWADATAMWQACERPETADPLITALRRDALQARPARFPAIAAAAAVLVAIIGGILVWPQFATRSPTPAVQVGPPAEAPTTFANVSGAPNTYALADGSRVTLNQDSAVTVAYEAGRRTVRVLRGQAFFSVTHDAQRPFIVAAQTRTITDLGTEFDVRIQGEGLAVTLVTGAIRVSAPETGRPIDLASPGAQLTVSPGQEDTVGEADLAEVLSWRTSTLEFSERPLAEALAEINRYGGPPARIVDPAVGSLPVTGRFRAGDPTRFALTLAEVYPLSVRSRNDGGVDLSGR